MPLLKIPDDITIKIDSRQEILDHARMAEAQETGKAKIAKEKTKRGYGCLTVIIVLIVAFVVLAIYDDYSYRQRISSAQSHTSSSSDYFSEMRGKHFEEIERLQAIEDEILEDIRNERYDQVLLKAQTLYYTTDYSNDTKEAWDQKREALIQQLNTLLGQQ